MSLAPIIIFGYNRPKHLINTLDALSNNTKASESEVFVFIDGKKKDDESQAVDETCEAAEKYINKASFGGYTVKKSDENRGLAASIISGVTEIVEKYGRVIVLEDDLLTSPDFISFMNDALDEYADNEKIWSVSGFSQNMKALDNLEESVYFTGRATSWGWATWKDRWEKCDWEVSDYEDFRYDIPARLRFNACGDDMSSMLDRQMNGRLDSWAIRWCYSQYRNKALTVFPKASKIKNLGTDGSGTNSGIQADDNHDAYDFGASEYHFKEPYVKDEIKKEFKARNELSIQSRVSRFIKYNMLNFRFVLNVFFFMICVFGAYISFKMNGNNRSLWLDEAALSYSFSLRDLSNLTAHRLQVGQSAPAAWLYLVKIITVIWGNTEYTLRISSVLAYIGSVILAYFISKKALKVDYPLGVAAFIAMIRFFIQYSNVFKPYEFDALCVLAVIWLYYLFKKSRINYFVLGLGWSVLIWFSNPVCFFAGGCILCELIFDFFSKDSDKWKKIFGQMIAGLMICVSFIINYIYWLSQSVDSMQEYWDGSQFPIIVTNKIQLRQLKDCVDSLIYHFEYLKYPVLILFLIGIIICIVKKEKTVISIYIGFLITIVASNRGFFPVSDRLWTFCYPLVSITALWTLGILLNAIFGKIFKNSKIGKKIGVALIGIIFAGLVCTNQGWRYLYTFNVWWPREELNTEIDYVLENIQEGESVYVTSHAMCGYQYKMGYDNHSIGGYEDNVYYNVDEDGAELVKSLDDCYIMIMHYTEGNPEDYITTLLDELGKSGYLQLVSYEHYTPLYFFTTDESHKKPEVDPLTYSEFN